MKFRTLMTVITISVLATIIAPSKAAAQGGASCYSSLISGPPQTLSAMIESLNSDGSITVNGVDTQGPNTPFQWAWGDGNVTTGWFPQSHQYAIATQNYVITITATENNGTIQQYSFPVFFVPPTIAQPSLPGISFQIPTGGVTFGAHYAGFTSPLLPPTSDTFFSASSFPTYSLADVADILTSISSIDYTFANGNSFLLNGVFQIDMLENPSFGGGYSFWYSTPMSVGYGSPVLQPSPQWQILFNEIGKDTTLNTPSSFTYGGNTDGPASEIYSETMGDIFSYASGCQLISNAGAYGLGSDVTLDIRNWLLAGAANLQSQFNQYVADGAPYTSWNPGTGTDPTGGVVATLAWKFIEHAEQNGQGYQIPATRMMTLLQQFNSSMQAGYSPDADSIEAETYRSTLMVAALSYAFSQDLRSEFEALNFPIDNGVFDQLFQGVTNGGAAWQQAPGSLSQISVGSDGTVWGLNSAGQPYMFNSQTQTWQQAPGLLQQIAVCSSGVVWGLNAAGQIYRYDPSIQSWDQIPGILSQLAVGSDCDVWGMNSSSQIYHFNASTQTWVQIPGALAQLAVGYDGAVWGINAAQQVYRFNPGTQNWQQVAGLLKRVAVGADGDVWGINSAGQTYHFNTLSQQWQNTGASLAQLAVGSASNVWGLDSGGGIWRFNGQTQTWNQVPGQLTQIAVGENGAVWGLNSAQQIYQFVQPTQATQTFHSRSGSLAQVVTGLDGNAWGIDASHQVWHFDAPSQSWQQIPGGLSQIAVGFGGNVWGLNAAGQIWQFNPSTQGWGAIGGSLAQIAVGADGTVWGLNSAGQIWRFNSSTQGFQQISGSLAQIAVGADGTVWGLNSAGQIFRFNPLTPGWDQIPGSLSQIAVGSANNVWGINATGQVFRYDSLVQSWDSIPGILTSLAVAFDGTVWGLNSANQIWRFNAQTQGWDSIAGQLTQISVGADAVVWGLDASGQSYEYW